MKAYVLRSYGPPDHLGLTDLGIPVPAAGEVLVRVRATSVNPYDWHHMRGEPRIARLMPGTVGLRAPKLRILGCDMAGQVEAAGQIPHLVAMLMEVAHDDPDSTLGWCDDQAEFEFGLDLILDGLDTMRKTT